MTKTTDEQGMMQELLEDREAELLDVLKPWVEDSEWGPMLRSPLVYQIPLYSPGLANKAWEHKHAAILEAQKTQDWNAIVWWHERPHRLRALIEYVLGVDDEGLPCPLHQFDSQPWVEALARAVWIDSENIQQHEEEWNAIFDGGYGIWLGDDEDKAVFEALPDPFLAYRGGCVGDFSWTLDPKVADLFARRSGFQKRSAMIPKADCFGYTNDRNEQEVFVRLTDERYSLVYPDRSQ